jgi:hypothetical protein
VLNLIYEHLIDATQVQSGTAAASATTITRSLKRFGNPRLGGQCTDNASDCVKMAEELAKSHPGFIRNGCLLHIMQLIIMTACIHAYGDDLGKGINTAVDAMVLAASPPPSPGRGVEKRRAEGSPSVSPVRPVEVGGGEVLRRNQHRRGKKSKGAWCS